MSRPLELDWKRIILRFLAAFLLSSGMAMCTLYAILPGQSVFPTLLWCGIFCLSLEGLYAVRLKHKAVLPLLLLLFLGIWGYWGGGPVHTLIQMGKAAYLTFKGIPDAALPYADAGRIALCLVFSLLSVFLSHDESVPLCCFCVIATAALCFVFGQGDEMLLWILPAFGGILLLLANLNDRRFSALPVAAVLTILAFLLVPGKTNTLPQLEQVSANIREFFEDYLFFNDYRVSFSLATEGYKPIEDRLGGPAAPENHTVMEVETGETVLLRGKTYDAYTGLDWYDSLSARRYLYLSPRYASFRDSLFDLNLPLGGTGGMDAKNLRVHLLSGGTTTLFVPQRTRNLQLENDRMVLYYNTAAELFITRNLEAGDGYTLTYLPFSPESERTRALISACASLQDPRYDEIAESYLALPDHIQKEVKDIAASVTAGCETPLDKALALKTYLQTHYRYTLDVKMPRENADFVAWFLLGEKEGYCTYFATAMTVLSRLAGLPARYVTGFLAVPDENGRALVTGEDAHAWTEIYLNGFGWLDFDATPRGDSRREDGGDDPSFTPPENAPTPTPEPPESTPAPEPENEPTPEETPAPTPTPVPEKEPSAPPSDPPNPPDPLREKKDFPWYIWAALLLLTLLLMLRFFQTEPVRRAARKPDLAAEIYMQGIVSLLSLRQVRRLPQETLQDFAQRADEALHGAMLPLLSPLTAAYGAQLYGRHRAAAEPFKAAYLAFRGQAAWFGRLRLALRRMAGRR